MVDKDPLVVNDDIVSPLPGPSASKSYLTRTQITFNTQGSSQWDSLRHFAYQKDKKFYNG